MKKIIFAVVAFAFVSRFAFAIDEGQAKGFLKVGKQQVELKFAYAHQADNEEGMLEKPELRILLCDREVKHELLAGYDGPMKIDALVRQGKLSGVLLKLDPKNLSMSMSGTVLVKPNDPQSSLIFFSSTTDEGLKNMKAGNNRVSGEVEYKSASSGIFEDMPAFEFQASFGAPLFRDEPVTARLVGARAAKSAPAKALIEYCGFLSKGDLKKASELATQQRWQEVESQRKLYGDEEFKKMLLDTISPVQLEKQIQKIFVRGSRAVVIIRDQGTKSAQSMVREGEVWKVD